MVLTWLSLPLKALGSSPQTPTQLPIQSCHWIVLFDYFVDKTCQMACFLVDSSSSIGNWLDATIMNRTVLLQEVWVDGGTFYSMASITVGEQSTIIWALIMSGWIEYIGIKCILCNLDQMAHEENLDILLIQEPPHFFVMNQTVQKGYWHIHGSCNPTRVVIIYKKTLGYSQCKFVQPHVCVA